ncbi:MAG TPA: alpha/beta hydrolase [Gemmatimonadales bacterium]|nr:alpha/beta hydrolase [Gemmatimonadales bacterium]
MQPPSRAVLPILFLLASSPLLAQSKIARATAVNVSVAPGESLHVVSAGNGAPVVLIPGLFGSAFGYRHLLNQLPRLGYRAVVVEPLAVGSSGRPERADYSLTAQADRVAKAIGQIEKTPVLLVAHSVNASTAMRLAVRHPRLVRGMVLLDGGPMEAAATRGFRRAMTYVPWIKWMGGMKRLRPRIRHDLIESSADSTWLTDAVLDGYTAGAGRDLDGTLKAYLRMAKAREPEKLRARLHEIRVPVRLLVGAVPHQGGISSDQIELLAKRVPHFVLERVPRAGHYLFEEAPHAVVAAILRTDESARTSLSAAGARP